MAAERRAELSGAVRRPRAGLSRRRSAEARVRPSGLKATVRTPSRLPAQDRSAPDRRAASSARRSCCSLASVLGVARYASRPSRSATVEVRSRAAPSAAEASASDVARFRVAAPRRSAARAPRSPSAAKTATSATQRGADRGEAPARRGAPLLLVAAPPLEDRLGEDVVEELVARRLVLARRRHGAQDAAALAAAELLEHGRDLRLGPSASTRRGRRRGGRSSSSSA